MATIVGVQALAENFIFGGGYNFTAELYAAEYGYSDQMTSLHSVPLVVLLDSGIMGLAFWGVFLWCYYKGLIKGDAARSSIFIYAVVLNCFMPVGLSRSCYYFCRCYFRGGQVDLDKWVFVGGMERAGTTSVFDYLTDSNEVISLGEKELSLFNLYDAYGRVQLDARRIAQVKKRNNNQGQYAKFVVDATPLYLTDSVAPLLIQELVACPYFIFVVRHPADRLMSDLRWVSTQFRDLDSFAYQQFALQKSLVFSGLTTFVRDLAEIKC